MFTKNAKHLVQLFIVGMLLLASASAQAQVIYRKLAFKDEFNKSLNSPVDSNKWTAEIGGQGWGNQELEYYTNSIENAYHDGNGSLIIKAVKLNPPLNLTCWYGPCNYTSARLITKQKFDQKYGRFEARIKIPKGQGMWAAFWLLGNDIDTNGWAQCGEIDIMENIGREPAIVHGTMHGPGYSGGNGIGAPYSSPQNDVFGDAFHTYRVDWTENKIEWFVDGKSYKTATPTNLPANSTWVFEHPFFAILNLAIGGPWGGSPDNTTVFPGVMMIDYVRVYKK